MMDVEESLALTFAARFNDMSPHDLRPRLLAAVTLMVMNASIISWFRGQHKDLLSAAKDVLSNVQTILCTDPAAESTAPAPLVQPAQEPANPGASLRRSLKKPR